MPEDRVAKRRAADRVENMSEDRVEQHRDGNRVENMSEDRIEQHRAGNRADNMSDDRVERHRLRNRVGGSLTTEFKESQQEINKPYSVCFQTQLCYICWERKCRHF